MNPIVRWRFGAVAGAVAVVAAMASLPAHALSLGRLSVLSALGEPLRAEIDVAQITPDEAASLKTAIGTPEAFKAAGLEYTPALAGLEMSLQRRPDGRSYLRLTSNRPVSEPFVDLVVQATWASGRLTRDYTMLFDPPATRSAAAPAPAAPVFSRPAAPGAQAPSANNAPSATPARPDGVQRPARAAPTDSASGERKVTVKAGDTAGQIAAQNKPGTISLDQMLIAMQRSNPSAFIGGNINRLKAGSVLDMPGADAASAISASEASQTVIAQSRDFNAFRRKLAAGVGVAAVDGPDRQATGKAQASVEDRAAPAAAPDKLTLSKGAVQGQSASEETIAKNRQASDASARVAELSKNISELNKLGVAPATATAAGNSASAAASAGKTPGVAVPAPAGMATPAAPVARPSTSVASAASAAASSIIPAAPAVTAAAAAASAASAPVASTTPQAAGNAESTTSTNASGTTPDASAAAATLAASAAAGGLSAASAPADSASTPAAPVAAASSQAAPTVLPPATNLLDDLLANPLILPLGAGLLALLAGLGIYSYRKKQASAPVDSSFLESRLQPDSFFGASGGQRIDTNESNVSGSSLVYSPSQLDAAGDVDPVAEADVYLAYGRDLQAEEILKEALRTTGTRVAIHAKLAEIYAKRRDSKSFETIALEAFNLTKGNGPEWGYITEIGRELDGVNPLYQPGGHPAGANHAATPTSGVTAAVASGAAGAVIAGTAGAAASASVAKGAPSAPVASVAPAPAVPAPAADIDVDLDFDFPLGSSQDGHTSPAPISSLDTAKPHRAASVDSLDMDFSDISSKPIALTYPVPIASVSEAKYETTIRPNGAMTATPTASPPAAAFDSGMLEFDLDSLSLDLNGPSTQSSGNIAERSNDDDGDHLQTKFDLAEEFRSLGDADGARSLAEEVLAEADGPLKIKAQAFLNSLM